MTTVYNRSLFISLLRYWNHFRYYNNNSNVNRRLGHVVVVITIMMSLYVVESAAIMNLHHSERNNNNNGSQDDFTTMTITRQLYNNNNNNDINSHLQSKQHVNRKTLKSTLRKGTISSSSSSTSLYSSSSGSNQNRYQDTPMIRTNRKSQEDQHIRQIKEDKDNKAEEVDDYYINEDNEQDSTTSTQEPSQTNQEQDDDVAVTQSPQDEEVDTPQENTVNLSPTSTPVNNVDTNDNDANDSDTTTTNSGNDNSSTTTTSGSNTKNQIDVCKDIVTNGIYNTTSTTTNPISIKYEYEVSTTISELQMSSISQAVQYYLIDTYMKPTCEDLLGNDMKKKYRLMQDDNFASYVSGVDAGNSILMSLPCSLSSEPSSSSNSCQRHQSINTIYVDNEYNSNTDDEWNRIRYSILYDLSSSFKDGTIISYYDLVRMDNPSLPQLSSIVYVYGTSATISIPTNGNSDASAAQGQVQPKNKDGLNGGLIFFFVLFILILCLLLTLVLLRKYRPQTFQRIKESSKKHSVNAIDKSKEVASSTYQKVKEKYYNYQAERNMKHMNNTTNNNSNSQHKEMNDHDDNDRDDYKFQPNIIISPQKTNRTDDNNSFNSGDYDDNNEYGLELILSDIEEPTNNSILNNSTSIYSHNNNNNTIMNDHDKNYSGSFFDDDDAFSNPTYNNNNNTISSSQHTNNTNKNNKQQDPIGRNARSKSARYSAYNNHNKENMRNNEQEVQLSKLNNNDNEQKTMNNIQQKATRTIPVEPINPNTVSPMHKKAMKFFEQRKIYGLSGANGGTPMRPTSHNKYHNENNNTSVMTPQQQNEHDQTLSSTIPNQQQPAVTPNKWTAATTRHLKQLAQNYYRLRSENSNENIVSNDKKQRHTPETLPYDDEIPIAMINNTIDNSFYCATNEDTRDFTLLSDVHVIVDDTSTHYTMDSSAILFDKNNNIIDDFDDDDDNDSEQEIYIPPRKTSVPDTVEL